MDDPRFSHLAYYERLVLDIKSQILNGALAVGDKLPSVRDMAKQRQLNPNTVAKAYKALEAQHVVVVKPGLGSYVAQTQPGVDDQTSNVLQARFQAVVVSALTAGVSLTELEQWLQDAAKGGIA